MEGQVQGQQQRDPGLVDLREQHHPFQQQRADRQRGDRGEHAPEPGARRAPRGDAPGAGQQQQRERIEQQQVLVGPGEAVLRAEPQEQHQRAEQAGRKPEQPRHGAERARRGACREEHDGPERQAGEQPGPPRARSLRRLRRDAVRQQRLFGQHERAAVGEPRLVEAVGQAHRHEGFFPTRQLLVGGARQADVEAQPHPRGR
jgi:hypothetical protein